MKITNELNDVWVKLNVYPIARKSIQARVTSLVESFRYIQARWNDEKMSKQPKFQKHSKHLHELLLRPGFDLQTNDANRIMDESINRLCQAVSVYIQSEWFFLSAKALEFMGNLIIFPAMKMMGIDGTKMHEEKVNYIIARDFSSQKLKNFHMKSKLELTLPMDMKKCCI